MIQPNVSDFLLCQPQVEFISIQLLAMSELNHELSISTKTLSLKTPISDTTLLGCGTIELILI